MLDLPPDGVKTNTKTSQTYFIFILGYIGPDAQSIFISCTVYKNDTLPNNLFSECTLRVDISDKNVYSCHKRNSIGDIYFM